MTGRWRVKRWKKAREKGGERGSGAGMATFLVGAAIALLSIVGLVLDGGAAAAGSGRAVRVATEAARAGLQAASLGGGEARDVVIRRGVDQYMSTVGGGVESWSTTVNGDTVTVTVTITEPTKILAMVGKTSWTVTRSGSAAAQYNP